MGALFEAVREACARPVWSRGGEIARRREVRRDAGRAGPGELALCVLEPGRPTATRVVLLPDEGEWECSCASRDDPCVHVAAAAIALHHGWLQEVERRLGYRFRREADGLHFERVSVASAGEDIFRGTLAGEARGAGEGPRIIADDRDQEIELILGAQRAGRLPRGILHKLIPALEGRPDLRLDGEPVRASAAPSEWRARLVDDGQGFRLFLERHPAVTEELGDGVVRCGDTLRVLSASGLEGRDLEALSRGRSFTPDQAAELASEVLPALRKRIAVAVETERLPEATSEPPRLVVETLRDGEALSVLATLVYGDPPRARVDAGRLVSLRGALPLRDADAEQRLTAHLRSSLRLEPGLRVRLEPAEALAFVARLEGFRGGESLLGLPDGGFAPLPGDWLARHGALVADLLAAREAAGGRLAPASLPDLARLCDELGAAAPPGLAALRPLLEGFAGIPEAALPADLVGSLRDYQRQGVDWLRFLGDAGLGALLADDMGLGKTVEALCAVRGRTLVVAPTSVLFGWAEEAARFRPALRRCLFHGAGRSLDPEAALTFTSYALLRLERDRLAAVSWDCVILDEAQSIKNPDSQAAGAARALRAKVRMALTGTPVENRLEELWSLFAVLNPGLLGSRRDFEERLARPIAAGDADAAERLRRRIRPFVLRRRKAEVARELPPKQELLVRVDLSEEERAVYDAIRAATLPEVVARLREGGSVLAALEALLRLRQACCHPGLLPGRRADGSAKLEALLERLDTAVADGHKALVFSQWTSLLDLAEPALRAAGIAFARLDGSTRDRPAVLAQFGAADGPPVLLVSLRAGGTGLNLTQADHVFLLDPWWNPAVEDQAADRAHRIGQTRPVLVHRLLARGTVEEGMLALQARKRALVDAALDEGTLAAALTREDLLGVLEGA